MFNYKLCLLNITPFSSIIVFIFGDKDKIPTIFECMIGIHYFLNFALGFFLLRFFISWF